MNHGQTSGPLATPSLLVDDVPHVRLPPPSSPLLGLSSDERGEVFRTEILAAGFTCDRVTLMERLPEWLPDRGHLFDPSGSTTLAVAARLGPTK